MCILWKPRQTLSLLFFFSVISMESGLQIMLSAWRCGRFSRMPQMDWWHPWVPQPVSLWYVRTQPPFYCVVFVHCQYLMVFLRWVGVWGGEKWCSWPPGCRSPSSSSWSDWGSCWEGEWLTPSLPQVGLDAFVILEMSPSWDSYHSLWLPEIQNNYCCQSVQRHRYWSACSMSNAPVGNQSSFGCPAQEKDVLNWQIASSAAQSLLSLVPTCG